MKKIILIFLIFLISPCFSIESKEDKIVMPQKENLEKQYELPIILEPEERAKETIESFKDYSKYTLKGLVEKEYDLNSTDGMFNDQLTTKFKRGIIKENTFKIGNVLDFSEDISSKSTAKFNYRVLNIGTRGKFKSEKESYNLLVSATPDVHLNFIKNFVLDAWISTTRIPNHSLTLGSYRPCVGYEGSLSAFLLPFVNRTQTARNFGNVRKAGAKIKGDFKYLDYEIGGYSSTAHFSNLTSGFESDMQINFKPLSNLDENKFGKLNIGGGYQIGEKDSKNYNVTSAFAKYDYKKATLLSELQIADGSNGITGYNANKRWGYNVTLAYKITKKLEFLLRYDDFDNNKKISNNNTKEYSAGINYFILGQTLKLVFNYIYSDNYYAKDSHKIIFATQILL